MAKKSFKDNPALQFITGANEPDLEEERTLEPDPDPARPTKATNKAPDGYKVNPLYIETKSRRLQLVLQPSVYERVKAAAKAKQLSVNEYIHQLLEEATREE